MKGSSFTAFVIVAAGSLASAACSGEADDSLPSVASLEQPIYNGVEATNNAKMVAVYYGGDRPCSGVYVADYLVLTARHCVTNGDSSTSPLLSPSQIKVSALKEPGLTPPSSATQATWVVDSRGNSQFSCSNNICSYEPTGAPHMDELDLAFVWIESVPRDERGWSLQPQRDLWAQTQANLDELGVTAVGYGMADRTNASAGVRRKMSSSISWADTSYGSVNYSPSGYFYDLTLRKTNGRLVDHGDSGGPWYWYPPHFQVLVGITQGVEVNLVNNSLLRGFGVSVAYDTPGGLWMRAVLDWWDDVLDG